MHLVLRLRGGAEKENADQICHFELVPECNKLTRKKFFACTACWCAALPDVRELYEAGDVSNAIRAAKEQKLTGEVANAIRQDTGAAAVLAAAGRRSRSRSRGSSRMSSKGKGASLRELTMWVQQTTSSDLVSTIAEAARELALRADREEVE